MNECRDCARYRFITRRVKGRVGLWETCGDNGRSTAFMRADYGVYGEPHCGPEGKLFTSKERQP